MGEWGESRESREVGEVGEIGDDLELAFWKFIFPSD